MKKVPLTEELKIRVSEPMEKALKRVAAKKASSPSQVGREAIQEFLVKIGELNPQTETPQPA